MSRKEKHNAVRSEFDSYVEHINNHMITNHGFHYLKATDKPEEWLSKIPYTAEREQEILTETQFFLTVMLKNSSNAKNPAFLLKLIDKIADFLSRYQVKSSDFCRYQGENPELVAKQNLFNRISASNRTLNQKTKTKKEKKAAKREKLKSEQAKAKEIHKDVLDLFYERRREYHASKRK